MKSKKYDDLCRCNGTAEIMIDGQNVCSDCLDEFKIWIVAEAKTFKKEDDITKLFGRFSTSKYDTISRTKNIEMFEDFRAKRNIHINPYDSL